MVLCHGFRVEEPAMMIRHNPYLCSSTVVRSYDTSFMHMHTRVLVLQYQLVVPYYSISQYYHTNISIVHTRVRVVLYTHIYIYIYTSQSTLEYVSYIMHSSYLLTATSSVSRPVRSCRVPRPSYSSTHTKKKSFRVDLTKEEFSEELYRGYMFYRKGTPQKGRIFLEVGFLNVF